MSIFNQEHYDAMAYVIKGLGPVYGGETQTNMAMAACVLFHKDAPGVFDPVAFLESSSHVKVDPDDVATIKTDIEYLRACVDGEIDMDDDDNVLEDE